MSKDKERLIAQAMYIDQCMTAKEIASRINVAEKTIGKWIDAGNWRELRLSKQTTSDVLVKKQNELLELLLDKRLKFEKKETKTDDDKADYKNIIDEMSKVSAMIDRIQKDGRISLRTHIHCLEKFMGNIHQKYPDLFYKLIDHQTEYLQQLAEELK